LSPSPEAPAPKGYSEESFRRKLSRHARTAGEAVVERALQFHYALQKPELPHWARARIIGALGYFVLPLDAVPDIVPGAGYADDLGVLALAFLTVANHIDDGVRAKARAQLSRWFKPKPAASIANENTGNL
jgi:uncharacterized membrane protein YkvA (DUF1232 family)